MEEKDTLACILSEIEKIIENDTLVLVEGKRDKASLHKLGIMNVAVLDKALFEVVEDLCHAKEIILLVDLDPHGKELYHRLKTGFSAHGVNVNDVLRRLLFKTPVRHVEGLARFLRNQTTHYG